MPYDPLRFATAKGQAIGGAVEGLGKIGSNLVTQLPTLLRKDQAEKNAATAYGQTLQVYADQLSEATGISRDRALIQAKRFYKPRQPGEDAGVFLQRLLTADVKAGQYLNTITEKTRKTQQVAQGGQLQKQAFLGRGEQEGVPGGQVELPQPAQQVEGPQQPGAAQPQASQLQVFGTEPTFEGRAGSPREFAERVAQQGTDSQVGEFDFKGSSFAQALGGEEKSQLAREKQDALNQRSQQREQTRRDQLQLAVKKLQALRSIQWAKIKGAEEREQRQILSQNSPEELDIWGQVMEDDIEKLDQEATNLKATGADKSFAGQSRASEIKGLVQQRTKDIRDLAKFTGDLKALRAQFGSRINPEQEQPQQADPLNIR